MSTLLVGKTQQFKTHDDVVKVWKSGDRVLYTAGEVITLTTSHVPSVPTGVVIGMTGKGPRPILQVLGRANPFNLAATVRNVIIQDLNIISQRDAACIADGGINTKIYRCANLGAGLFLQMQGKTSTQVIDCQDSVDPRSDGRPDNSRVSAAKTLGALFPVWQSKYSIYGGPGVDKNVGMSAFFLQRYWCQARDTGAPGDTLHALRLHSNRNVKLDDVFLQNTAARGRTCFTLKEWGPISMNKVRTSGADNSLGPLGTAAGGDPPNWRELALEAVTLTDCDLHGKNWALDIEAGVHNLTMLRGSLSGKQCCVNVRIGYSGCVPDTRDPVTGKLTPAHPLPNTNPPVRMSRDISLQHVRNAGTSPLVNGVTSVVKVI